MQKLWDRAIAKQTNLNKANLNDKRPRFMVKRWEAKRQKIPGKKGAEAKYKTVMTWQYEKFTYGGLLKRYIQLLEDMSLHTFYAAWNYHHYIQCKRNLESGEILSVLDYAQNYLCVFQNEVQALHWAHAQVTIHPFTVTYRCPGENCNELVNHEIVHFSDDRGHDAHLVKKMTAATIELLQARGVEIRKIYEFTDQAPSQYKSKTAFRYMSQSNIPTLRTYFGARHGKGPCDACTGRVKKELVNLVRTENVELYNAETCFNAAEKHLTKPKIWPRPNECAHSMLSFIKTDKIACRPNTKDWKGIKGTREELHSVMNTGKALKVNVRKICCHCRPCMDMEGRENCLHKEYYSDWCGWDLSNGTEIPADVCGWTNVAIRKIIGSAVNYNWSQEIGNLAACNSFDQILDHVTSTTLPAMDCFVSNTLIAADRPFIDLVALHYKPPDVANNLTPIKIYGDGNCFPRALSYLCFKTEDRHEELCVRLVHEAVSNAKHYVNNRYLARGAEIIYRSGGPCKQIALYSSSYIPPNPVDVVQIYKAECLEIAKPGSYCGLWQLCQAANVLRRPVRSVYPVDLNPNTRLDFDRQFYCIDNYLNSKQPVTIMWTPMQVTEAIHVPCHFVPLLAADGAFHT